MNATPNWHRCITHHDHEVAGFVEAYFADLSRRCLLIAGAGFDPRNADVPALLARTLGNRLEALYLRERRPKPPADLVARGDVHAEVLARLVTTSQVLDVQVLSEVDRAVVGGRRAVQALAGIQQRLGGFTDIVLDPSALSVGISFPVAKYLLQTCRGFGTRPNLHLMVASHPQLDAAIASVPNDAVDPVHGFSGRLDLEGSEAHAKIWIPHLPATKVSALQLVRDKLRGPITICPVLPLSQRYPRAGDRLIEAYENELYDEWEVEPANLIYAVEDDPLDLYRTITAIYCRYTGVFADLLETHVVLTPSGNKVLAIGALMAAIEHELPVRYVEAVAYEVDWPAVERVDPGSSRLIHVWLHGEPYAAVARGDDKEAA